MPKKISVVRRKVTKVRVASKPKARAVKSGVHVRKRIIPYDGGAS